MFEKRLFRFFLICNIFTSLEVSQTRNYDVLPMSGDLSSFHVYCRLNELLAIVRRHLAIIYGIQLLIRAQLKSVNAEGMDVRSVR